MIKTGVYTGNGVDDRTIDIGTNLAAKNNVYVSIKHPGLFFGHHRIEYAQGDLSMYYDNQIDAVDRIQAHTATGFQIGANDGVNENGIVFRYVVRWEEP